MPFRSRQKSISNNTGGIDNSQRRQMLKRHSKSKFSEGEVVLCYEPDPAKTKVLYSSKVIQIVEKYDDNDRRYEEYLIHFHGWNSTWDRYVTEDYILKDTPENRKLQQELANEAQLTPGGNLYKRDLRNRRRSSTSRRKLKNSESSHSNIQRSNDGEGTSQVGTTQDEYSDKSSDDEGMYISLKELPPLPVIRIPAVLKKVLGYDEYLITKKKKLHRLPAEPTMITILETFVHQYVTFGLRTFISKQTRRVKYEDLVPKVHLCKEVVDGLRIIFDFTVDNLFMYGNERPQFSEIRNISLQPPPRPSISAFEKEIKETDCAQPRTIPISDTLPSLHTTNESKVNSTVGKRVLRSQHQHSNADSIEVPVVNCEKTNEKLEKPEASTSQKKEEFQNSVPSSSCSSNGIAPPDNLLLDGSIIYSRHIEKLVHKELSNWRFIPDSIYFQKPLKPSLVYGATHLSRLFVKLPEILQYSHQRVDATEMTVEFSEALLSFLAEHLEWFGDDHYVDNSEVET